MVEKADQNGTPAAHGEAASKPKSVSVSCRVSQARRSASALGITLIADDFDGPLPDDIQEAFEGDK